tara:strand:+ start:1180 stop:1878 length:699 start_codon:yes stop_codon:yes gene_type:complete
MVSIQSVYEAVKDLANKDQKGFVTPEIFNSFAKIAQLNIYYEIFQDLIEGNKGRKMNIDPSRNLSVVNRTKGDLSTFLTKTNLSKSGGVFKKPEDTHSVVSINYKTSSTSKTVCHLIYDEDKIQHIINSTLSAPSVTFPVALIADSIEVFPTTISKVELRYYRGPSTPSYQVEVANITAAAEISFFNPSTSEDFELPYHYEQDLVYEIAKMIGLNVRDIQVEQFAETEDNKQ